MKYQHFIFISLLSLLWACNSSKKEHKNSEVQIAGAMKNVMWKGELDGVISLDTISEVEGLYGLGPLAFLKGEILLLDGITYISKIIADGTPEVIIQEKTTAPFFVYGNATQWIENTLPNHVTDLKTLESYITTQNENRNKPFILKLEGKVKNATYHIQNLADNSVVTNPKEAHEGQQSFELTDEEVIIVGFYSKNHKGIFTHHDTNMHLHIITKDKKEMGHLDELLLIEGSSKIYLSE